MIATILAAALSCFGDCVHDDSAAVNAYLKTHGGIFNKSVIAAHPIQLQRFTILDEVFVIATRQFTGCGLFTEPDDPRTYIWVEHSELDFGAAPPDTYLLCGEAASRKYDQTHKRPKEVPFK